MDRAVVWQTQLVSQLVESMMITFTRRIYYVCWASKAAHIVTFRLHVCVYSTSWLELAHVCKRERERANE